MLQGPPGRLSVANAIGGQSIIITKKSHRTSSKSTITAGLRQWLPTTSCRGVVSVPVATIVLLRDRSYYDTEDIIPQFTFLGKIATRSRFLPARQPAFETTRPFELRSWPHRSHKSAHPGEVLQTSLRLELNCDPVVLTQPRQTTRDIYNASLKFEYEGRQRDLFTSISILHTLKSSPRCLRLSSDRIEDSFPSTCSRSILARNG